MTTAIECKMVEASDGMIYFIPVDAICPHDKTDIDAWEAWHEENFVAQFWDSTLFVE